MRHPKVRLLVMTGGLHVVKAATSSGKLAICAGPGNPPVVWKVIATCTLTDT